MKISIDWAAWDGSHLCPAQAVEIVLGGAFFLGVMKRFTYGTVLVLHAISTFSSSKQNLALYDGPNILFFAAWPMPAACPTLYLLRDRDVMLTLGA